MNVKLTTTCIWDLPVFGIVSVAILNNTNWKWECHQLSVIIVETCDQIFYRWPLCPADHHELQQKMEKKERECDAKTQEKEEMMQTLNKMKEKLEREMGEHKLVKQQVAEMTARLHDLSTVGWWCHKTI